MVEVEVGAYEFDFFAVDFKAVVDSPFEGAQSDFGGYGVVVGY